MVGCHLVVFSQTYNEVYLNEISRYSCTLRGSTSSDNQEETAKGPSISDAAVEQQDLLEVECDTDTSMTIEEDVYYTIGEIAAKTVANAYWKEEVNSELADLGLDEKWTFKHDPGSLSGTYDVAMEYADKHRSHNIYSHDCSEQCKKKGCGALYVADGNWKHRHLHCMWKVPVEIKGFGQINYPSVCPLTPVRGKAFCTIHVAAAEKQQIKTDLKAFLKTCGLDDDDYCDSDGMVLRSHDKVEQQLDKLSKSCTPSKANATTFQGTSEFLEKHPSIVDGSNSEPVKEVMCNKDTGGKTTLHSWSRGSMWIVTAGGMIEYFQPLYRSESPTHAFVIFLSWLLLKIKPMLANGSAIEDVSKVIKSITLSYDNMCHVNNMKICRQDLPLPAPLHTAWKDMGKVIDRLHLRNHKDSNCKRYYNPEGRIPKEYNSMAAEQTFVWASRMKKIVCAMPRLHHFFYLHRSIKRRNAYTQRCYKQNKNPVLSKLSKDHYNKCNNK